MKKKILSGIVFTLFILFSVSLVSAATTRYVDDDNVGGDVGGCTNQLNPCETIQYAIDEADADDMIEVADGNYDAFNANKEGITVKAASTPKITANPITIDGQDNAIVVSAHNVTIDGFTIDANQFSTGIKIYDATTPPHGAVIKNNVIDFTSFDPSTMPGSTYGGGCIQAKAGGGPPTIIEDNYVAFDAASMHGGHEGIAVWGAGDADYIIRGNTVNMSDTTKTKYHNGISVHGTNDGSVLIDDNTVYVSQKHAEAWKFFGIYLLGIGGASGEYLNNAIVTNNVVTGLYSPHHGKYVGYALRMTGPHTNHIDIMYNDFKNWDFGMVVENDASSNDVHVNCNNIFGNTHGLATGVGYTIPVPTLDAENNWWGDASGPSHPSNPGGSGDTVSDNVDFEPWEKWEDPCKYPLPSISPIMMIMLLGTLAVIGVKTIKV